MEIHKKFDAQNYKDTTSVFEKYTIRGIIVRDGKIAMQCSKEGEYKIPGGGMEAGETYVEALAREVKEETGLFIIPEKAVGLGYRGGLLREFSHSHPSASPRFWVQHA